MGIHARLNPCRGHRSCHGCFRACRERLGDITLPEHTAEDQVMLRGNHGKSAGNRTFQLALITCIMIPLPFIILGQHTKAQFAFGFSTVMILVLSKGQLLFSLSKVFASFETRFNLWLGLLFCQVALAIHASIKLFGSLGPGLALCLGGLVVARILHSFGHQPQTEG